MRFKELLVENSYVVRMRIDQAVRAVAPTLHSWVRPDHGSDNEPVTPEAIPFTVNRLAALVQNDGSMIVYRYIWMTPEAMDALQPGTALGHCWTTNYADMYLGALTGYDEHPEGAQVYLIKAHVGMNAIDWKATVTQQMTLPWENEIVVAGGFKVMHVWHLGDADISYFDHAKPVSVRPDLRNKSFRP